MTLQGTRLFTESLHLADDSLAPATVVRFWNEQLDRGGVMTTMILLLLMDGQLVTSFVDTGGCAAFLCVMRLAFSAKYIPA